jgi:NAD(P)-dependent dehydrogenase (short-subunit alcohol dehydrogenase family)
MDYYKDKVAIVTGGASGIGRALCKLLGQRGAQVVVADINGEGAERVASALSESGGRAKAAYLDVSEQKDVRALIDETAARMGRLDIMFNNAGIGVGGEERDIDLEHWQRVLSVNLWGVIYGTTAAYSLMAEQGFGHIINTASLAGLIPTPTLISYCAAKHAVVGLSCALRAEGADLGVKVSVVCPGLVDTAILHVSDVINADLDDLREKIPFKMMDATQAGRAILRGVRRNRPIIIFPFHARFYWWLHRLLPVFAELLERKAVRDFRALRKDPQKGSL